jgi:SAM-dependent methyltransferase
MQIEVTDQQLADINGAFDWLLTQYDDAGRAVGGGERVFRLRDNRLVALLGRMPIAGLRVLEPGCLEGQVTVGLCEAGAEVTAFDVRPTCVIKTFARCLAFGYQPRLLLHDARRMAELGRFDLVFHAGLFYHLSDPMAHLREIAEMAPLIAIDTHTARRGEPLEMLAGYEGHWYGEFGWSDEQSGVERRSFWLTKAALQRLFADCGLSYDLLLDDDTAEHGPRSLYLLRKN